MTKEQQLHADRVEHAVAFLSNSNCLNKAVQYLRTAGVADSVIAEALLQLHRRLEVATHE
jgi:hypothetical protein